MPEAGSKKRSNQQTGSGKLSKRGGSVENALQLATDVATEEADAEKHDEFVEQFEVPEPIIIIPEPIKDIMRTEPMLNSVFIEHYEGGCDDNGFYHGEGTVKLIDGLTYNGLFKHGKMNDYGVLKWPNCTTYSGDFKENVISGNGSYSWPDGSTYKGDVLNGQRHGYGTFICSDLKTYTGHWKNGMRHGEGILYYDESGLSYYNGEWSNNEKCGYGVRQFANGNVYEGEWKENKRNGQGTMYWHTSGQQYTGNWVDGIQNGHGEYSWYLKRVANSQYPLRNKYVGNFFIGKRHGRGKFYYASGAIYDGEWEYDAKHGQGKFTFKNGSIFVGQFHKDRMIDFPDLILPRMMTPDIMESGIPIKPSSALRSKSVMQISRNAVDAFLDLDLDDIFYDYKYDLEQRQEEVESIMRTILRHTTRLKNIYKVYSCLGSDISVDNTFAMSKCQFLRFLKDHDVHRLGYTLTEIDRYLEEVITLESCFKVLFIRDFLNYLVKISYFIFRNDIKDDPSIISNCFSNLISCIIKETVAPVKGYMFIRTILHVQEIYKYIDQIFEVYFYFAALYYPSSEITLKLHDVLLIFKDLHLINDTFNSTELVNVLTNEDKDEEGYYNLDKEITPFEFLEVVVGSSSVFITDKLVEAHQPGHIMSTMSLSLINTVDEPVLFVKEEEGETKDEDVNNLSLSVNQEETLSKDSTVELSTISPAKSSKSSGKMSKKVVKKLEKEISGGNVLRPKKDGSKSGRRTSSIRMDDTKGKSFIHGDIDAPVSDTNQDNTLLGDKSHNSTVEKINSEVEDVIEPSDTEVALQTSLETDVPNNCSLENVEVEAEKPETFEVWSLRFNLFLKEYLFPAYEKRKVIEEMICMKTDS